MLRLVRDILLWLVWVPFRFLLKPFPLRFLYACAGMAANLAFAFPTTRRKVLIAELGALYGDRLNAAQLRQAAKGGFRIYFMRQVENLVFGSLSRDRVDGIAEIEGLEHLDSVLARGKGAVLLLAHFGSFLLPLPALGHRGYRIVQVAGKPLIQKRGWIHKKIHQARKSESDRLPIKFVLTDRYLGPVVRELRRNAVVVIAFDGRTGSKWMRLPLLNRSMDVSPGPFNLGAHTGAGIIPTFVVRQPDNRHRIVLGEELILSDGPDRDSVLEATTRKFIEIFEHYLLEYPDHFAMTLYTAWSEARKGLNRPLFSPEMNGATADSSR